MSFTKHGKLAQMSFVTINALLQRSQALTRADLFSANKASQYISYHEPISPGASRISFFPQGQNFTSDTQ